jgi:EAL domain-containing protein (putative c-di-GMP-specific phosphodiesterase class I)
VDALQLQEPRFVERLKGLLAQYPDVQPSKLELEVLESSAFQDVARLRMSFARAANWAYRLRWTILQRAIPRCHT